MTQQHTQNETQPTATQTTSHTDSGANPKPSLFDDLPVPPAQAKKTAAKPTPATLTNIKTIDIVIAGATYSINCPVNEQDALIRASDYINATIKDLRKNAPALTHEHLLVLCCLNMFGQMDKQGKQQKSALLQEQAVQKLLDKITKEAESILPV